MAITEAPAGVPLTTTLATIYTNAAGSGFRKQVRVRFCNVNGTNDGFISACKFVDVSPAGTFDILPVNAKVAKADAIAFTKVLEPGDSIQASASAANFITAVPDVIWSEPA